MVELSKPCTEAVGRRHQPANVPTKLTWTNDRSRRHVWGQPSHGRLSANLFLDVSLRIVAVPQYKQTESAHKWHGYKPASIVKSVDEFLSVVDGDPYGCFFG